ncbi:hypothetical protein ABEB36_005455 [Hypothenemus hampei]|uniref:Uncharacterized protein n=1 Tax=Hypothenemus hampei TaxID=57062 RepID=A0ABD1EYA0_HYPHA
MLTRFVVIERNPQLRKKMRLTPFLLLYLLQSNCKALFDDELDLTCKGKTFRNVTLTAYFPDYTDSDHEFGYQDKRGRKLRTLQDYLDDRAEFVTLSMDDHLGIPYGTQVCIPELNKHFGHKILLEVRDSSYDLLGRGYSRADICVRTEIDSYDLNVNKFVTLVFV